MHLRNYESFKGALLVVLCSLLKIRLEKKQFNFNIFKDLFQKEEKIIIGYDFNFDLVFEK